MTTPQTDAGRTFVGSKFQFRREGDREIAPKFLFDERDLTVEAIREIEREATEHVLEVAARLLPPTDVSALRDALRENR